MFLKTLVTTTVLLTNGQFAVMGKTIDANDPSLKNTSKIKLKVHLYFKYLKTIYPISEVNKCLQQKIS
jgi:hypothetical protein